MTLASLAEKIDYVRETRSDNYRESMRLEGYIINPTISKSQTKKDIIAKYKALYTQSALLK